MESSQIDFELDDSVVEACKRTSLYLLSAAEYVLNGSLPICLASAWSSKARRMSKAPERLKDGRCLRCGVSFKNKRSFDLQIKEAHDIVTVEGLCCGCKQVYYCGEIDRPACSAQPVAESGEGYVTDTSLLEETFDARNICASSTPLMKHKLPLAVTPRTSDPKIKRARKRRGSALERLLKEEDSATDRSLSGFLKLLAK